MVLNFYQAKSSKLAAGRQLVTGKLTAVDNWYRCLITGIVLGYEKVLQVHACVL